jgi:hypothetical protein
MLTRWKLRIAGAVLALLSAIGAYLAGRRHAKEAAANAALKGYANTRKEMDDADAALGDDPVVLRDWLRERAER